MNKYSFIIAILLALSACNDPSPMSIDNYQNSIDNHNFSFSRKETYTSSWVSKTPIILSGLTIPAGTLFHFDRENKTDREQYIDLVALTPPKNNNRIAGIPIRGTIAITLFPELWIKGETWKPIKSKEGVMLTDFSITCKQGDCNAGIIISEVRSLDP